MVDRVDKRNLFCFFVWEIVVGKPIDAFQFGAVTLVAVMCEKSHIFVTRL